MTYLSSLLHIMCLCIVFFLSLSYKSYADNKTIYIQDHLDRSVAIHDTTRAIIIPHIAVVPYAALDKGADNILGTVSMFYRMLDFKDNIVYDMYPDFRNKKSLGKTEMQGIDPNLEFLILQSPSLVIQWGRERNRQSVERIAQIGIPTIGLNYGPGDQLVEDWINLLSDITQNTQLGRRLIKWREDTKRDILDARTDEAEYPKVLFLQKNEKGHWISLSSSNIMQQNINLVGALNIVNDDLSKYQSNKAKAKARGTRILNEEHILEYNPDIIFLNSYSSYTPIDMYNDPILKELKASKNKRIYHIPLGSYRWDSGITIESPLLWMWMSNLIHPDIFDYNIRDEVIKAYKWIYDFDITNNHVDKIIKMSSNKNSYLYREKMK